jgi:hypothetical protein
MTSESSAGNRQESPRFGSIQIDPANRFRFAPESRRAKHHGFRLDLYAAGSRCRHWPTVHVASNGKTKNLWRRPTGLCEISGSNTRPRSACKWLSSSRLGFALAQGNELLYGFLRTDAFNRKHKNQEAPEIEDGGFGWNRWRFK